MTNEEAINVLTLHKEHWERLVREHIAEKQEGNEMVEALGKAIEALRQMDNCPVYSDEVVKQPCIESPCSKSNEVEDFKKFVESRLDMQDLYLPIHFFDLLDEYCGTDMREADNEITIY